MWGGVYELDAPYRVERRYMDAYMVQYVERGALHFRLRGEHFVAHAGELVLLSCREENLYWTEEPSRVRWFHFNGKGVDPLLEFIYAQNGNGLICREKAEESLSYIDAVLSGLRMGEYGAFQFSREIYGMLCEIAAQPEQEISSARVAIQRSVTFMKQHFHEDLTVQQIASEVGLSPFYFSRLFKKLMLTSPHAYLLNLRLGSAKKRLVYTTDTVDCIARDTGFQSSSYFIRAFRRSMNMTPNAFRRYFSGLDPLKK